MTAPIFILSSGRSGSTLLASMLDRHPQLYVPAELFGLYSQLPRRLRYYGNLDLEFNRILLARDLSGIGQLAELGITFDTALFSSLLDARGKTLRCVIDCFYDTLLSDTGKNRIVDKTPNNGPYVQEIRSLYPDAKVIHLLRDGRECALSLIRSRTGLNYRNVAELARKWPRSNRLIERVCGGSQYLRVSYEALTAAPEDVLRRICGFLELPYSADLLHFQSGEFAQRNAADLPHHANLTRELMSDNTEKWRKEMTPIEIAIYEAIAGAALEHFGYRLSDQLDYPAGWRLQLWLKRLETAARWCLRGLKNARISLQWLLFTYVKRVLGVYRLSDARLLSRH